MTVAVAALAVGLALGPLGAAVVLVVAGVLLLGALAGAARGVAHARVLAGAALALTLGATVADARLAALEHGPERSGAPAAAMRGEAVLLEPVRQVTGGRSMVIARAHDGRRLLLRAGPGARWPRGGPGSMVAWAGRARAPGPQDGWLTHRHVAAIVELRALRDTGGTRGGVAGALDTVRRRGERALTRRVPDGPGGLLRGMVLGQDSALDPGLREAMRRSGLTHLTAASGQNVMLLAALTAGVAVVLGLGLRTRLAATLLLIAAYVPIAGGGPSIQRAGVMGAAALVAVLAGRPAARWHALALAAAATLALNPLAWRDPGWQLSFVAVLSLLAVAPRLRAALRGRGLTAGVAGVLAVTVAATIATAPLIAWHFGRTSLVAIPANAVAAVLVAPAMWLGLLAAAAGQVSLAAAAPPAALAAWPAAGVAGVAEFAASVPGAEVAAPVGLVMLVAAALTLAALRPATVRPVAALGLAAAVAALLAAPAPARPPSGPRVAFLDVGQGDATLLQDGSHAVLVDTGPPGGEIRRRLAAAGARRLDALVVTHAQADHLGAAAEILGRMPVGMVLDGRDGVREPHGTAMGRAARRARVRVVPGRAGTVVRAGGIVLRLRWPPPQAPVAGADPNDRSIVAEARVGALRVLLTADAESEVLRRLDLGPTDVLKVAHHGSADPGLPDLLTSVRPRLAVIQVGRRNRHGHPTPGTLGALRAAGVPVLRTDRDGSMTVTPQRDGTMTITTLAGGRTGRRGRP